MSRYRFTSQHRPGCAILKADAPCTCKYKCELIQEFLEDESDFRTYQLIGEGAMGEWLIDGNEVAWQHNLIVPTSMEAAIASAEAGRWPSRDMVVPECETIHYLPDDLPWIVVPMNEKIGPYDTAIFLERQESTSVWRQAYAAVAAKAVLGGVDNPFLGSPDYNTKPGVQN